MKHIFTGTLVFLCSLGILHTPVIAEENHTETKSSGQVEKVLMAENPFMGALREKSEALVAGLEEKDLKALYDIRHLFGMARSVRIVHGDVKKTVSLCADEHENLKEEVTNRFYEWDMAIIDAVEEAEGKMQIMIAAQTSRPAEQIREYLRLTKEAADFTESQIDKQPVTTEEACRALIQSMDNTQQTLTAVLYDISEAAMYPADSYIADPEVEDGESDTEILEGEKAE